MANLMNSKISPELPSVTENKVIFLKTMPSIITFKAPITENKKYRVYRIVRKHKNTVCGNKSLFKEHNLIRTYANIYLSYLPNKQLTAPISGNAFTIRPMPKISTTQIKERRGYIKHITRLRYGWHFRRELGQFKLFRKFFKRSLKRYRKIQKNRLFVTKFRKNFSKLTGFNEKFIYTRWAQFRKNYNQYWSISNIALRFSQSLMLAPYGFLVIAKIAPSLASSKHLIDSGAISINGMAVTSFANFIPGDILQINLSAFQALSALFNYQRWGSFNAINNTLPFICADWSSMIFMLLRWPHNYELLAPSFLSERWMRYYIRNFPSKAAKFKKMRYNTKIYKQPVIKK